MTAGRTVNPKSQDWGTPKKYVDAVKRVFNGIIELDPCSSPHSIVRAKIEYMLPDQDGLQESWNSKTIYMNPPYGTDRKRGTKIGDWLQRCVEANKKYNSEVLALVPVATNTGHWKKNVWGHATGICFLYDTRLKFLIEGKDEGKGAPMSCAMIYWGDGFQKFFDIFIEFGSVIDTRSLQKIKIGKYKRIVQPTALNRWE